VPEGFGNLFLGLPTTGREPRKGACQLAHGFDHNSEIDLSFSHPLRGELGLTGEIYGDPRWNRAVPGFVSTSGALTYTITPRLVVDAGMDVALTPDAPFRKRLVMGFVYSLAELYPHIRRHLKGN